VTHYNKTHGPLGKIESGKKIEPKAFAINWAKASDRADREVLTGEL